MVHGASEAIGPQGGQGGDQEVREFRFASEDDLYGFVNIGARVCQVIPGSPASKLGVLPGWYVAAVDGEELPGAMVGICRRVPGITTDELRERLRMRRAAAVRRCAV